MNKYYVYEHIRKDTDQVFYVGKGQGNRAFDKNNRSPEWNKIVSEIEYKIKIVQDNMEEKDAYALENQLIFEYGFMIEGGILVNKKFNHFKYNELLEYELETNDLENENNSEINQHNSIFIIKKPIKRRFTVEMPVDLFTQLQEVAEQNNITVSSLVNDLLKQSVQLIKSMKVKK